MTTIDLLSAAFQQWTTEQGLPAMSADELVVGDSFGLSPLQREWLEAFVELWDVTNKPF